MSEQKKTSADQHRVTNIIIGQKITTAKKELARQLRAEMTPEERMLWAQLRRRQLDDLHFRRQQIIGGFIVDFYCHEVGLVLEIDGCVHETQVEYDAQRDEYMEALGLIVLRIQNSEIRRNTPGVLQHISEIAASQTRRPTYGSAGRKTVLGSPVPSADFAGTGDRRSDCTTSESECCSPLPASGRGRGRGSRGNDDRLGEKL